MEESNLTVEMSTQPKGEYRMKVIYSEGDTIWEDDIDDLFKVDPEYLRSLNENQDPSELRFTMILNEQGKKSTLRIPIEYMTDEFQETLFESLRWGKMMLDM